MISNCNEANCNCPKKECERHGKCCECVNFHQKNPYIVYCMRRPAVKSKTK